MKKLIYVLLAAIFISNATMLAAFAQETPFVYFD